MSKKLLRVSKEELTKKEKYLLTCANNMRMIKELDDGEKIDVALWCIFNDEKDDAEDVTILSIIDNDGNIYATNSETFRRKFEEIADVYDDEGYAGFTIEKLSGETKAGRPFVYCALV